MKLCLLRCSETDEVGLLHHDFVMFSQFIALAKQTIFCPTLFCTSALWEKGHVHHGGNCMLRATPADPLHEPQLK
jgi:hypothetical protein